MNSKRVRNRIFEMVSTGVINDRLNQSYDIISTLVLLVNLVAAFAATYENVNARYGSTLATIEAVTVFFFAVDYVLRLMTSDYLFPGTLPKKAMLKYIFSAAGIIDLLSFLPYYLPFFFPAGTAVFRLFRVARIFRLFRINAYYDSLNVISEVLNSKKQQLLSSVFIIVLLMIAASLCMYSVEHEAQPEVFSNAFSGIWWAASTVLTIGYGDIYPVTLLGKLCGIIIGFCGVGVVAIPTGIISAGFVEQYTRLKNLGDYATETDVSFMTILIEKDDNWAGERIRDLNFPRNMMIAAIGRDDMTILPRGDVEIREGDRVILATETIDTDEPIRIKELSLKAEHPWKDKAIKDLDIPRKTFIVMVKRDKKTIIPKGRLVLKEGDTVVLISTGRGTFLEEHPF